MSPETVQENITQEIEVGGDEANFPLSSADLIFDDGEPLESYRHRIAMNVLIDSLEEAWSGRKDFFTGGNMFLYYDPAQARNRNFRGPDFLAVLNVDKTKIRKGWVVWEENNRYPDIIVELMSPSTAEVDKTTKKEIYCRIFKTREYFIFDPYEPNSLQGWRLNQNLDYEDLIPNEQGWLWSSVLAMWLGTWSGIVKEPAIWLRFYDRWGNLQLLPDEAARIQVEQQRQIVEQEQQRAEQEQQRAEQERQRAEQEQQRAEQEQQRADILAAQLRALGIEPQI
jgi:Uma2 family endonuclease